MKEIRLMISEKVVDSLSSAIVAKQIATSFYGVIDEFASLVVDALEEGKPDLTVIEKAEHKG